jgi:uncharacterized phiE125 gp8 family phage protein
MISLVRTVAPTVEPVTLDEAKDQCRVDNDNDNAYIETLITAARIHVEKQTNRALLLQTWRMSLDRFPGYQPWNLGSPFAPVVGRQFSTSYVCGRYMQPPLLLPKPPLIEVASIKYYDINGSQQTLDPSLYIVNSDGEPATIYPIPFTWWPATIWGRPDAVQVTFTAGYGESAEDVPENLKLAEKGLIAHWYENRESVALTNSTNAVTTIPQFVDALLGDDAVIAFTFED